MDKMAKDKLNVVVEKWGKFKEDTEWKKMMKKLKEGGIIALKEDLMTGKVKYGGSYDNGSQAAGVWFNAQCDEDLLFEPNVIFLDKRGFHALGSDAFF